MTRWSSASWNRPSLLSSRNLPGGFNARILFAILAAILVLSIRFERLYRSFSLSTNCRKSKFPGWFAMHIPRPRTTSFGCGYLGCGPDCSAVRGAVEGA